MIFEGYEYFILFLAGFFSGAINTVAGGGSLLTLPILIFMGLFLSQYIKGPTKNDRLG